MITTAIRRSAPVATFNQIQEHQLDSAEVLYHNGVEGNETREKVLRMLLEPYMKRVDKAHENGKINDSYHKQLSEIVSDMGYQ